MKWFAALSVFTALLALAPPEHCSGAEQSNLQFIENLTDSLLQEIFEHSFENKPVRIAIRNLGVVDEKSWFFENRIIETLGHEGVSLFLAQEDGDADANWAEKGGVTVEFMFLDLDIEYGPKTRKSEHTVVIQRTGKVDFSLRVISQPEGKILWSGTKEGTKFDWIPLDSLNDVENSNCSFVKGKRIKDSKTGSIFQPVLISAVTGVIAYLFYSLRSR